MIKLKESELLQCCGSTRWAREMAAHSFPNPKEVYATADSIWWSLTPADWNEAFRALASSKLRIHADSETDPKATAEEQRQITHLRLKRILTGFR
jgi:hypothetical protein